MIINFYRNTRKEFKQCMNKDVHSSYLCITFGEDNTHDLLHTSP